MPKRTTAEKKVREEAGTNDRNRGQISIRLKDRPAWKTAAVGLAGMWGQIHVDLKQQIADSATHEAALVSGDFTLAYSGDAESSGDPALYAMRFVKGDAMNYFRYDSPDAERAIRAALAERDAAKRNALRSEEHTSE